MKCLIMVSYPKVESDDYSCVANTYVKPKGSKIFINLQNNYSLIAESVAKIYINRQKYEYEWFDVALDSGDIIKHEIVRTYKTKDGSKNKKEVHYYLVKKNSSYKNENPFPIVAGDIYELDGDYKDAGEIKNAIRNKKHKISR